jgi:hypothetical protein
MSSFKVKVTLGVVLVLSCAVAALVDDARHADADGSLAQACAGMPASHKLERALFNVRAQSNGGFDPICGAIESPTAAAGQPPPRRYSDALASDTASAPKTVDFPNARKGSATAPKR